MGSEHAPRCEADIFDLGLRSQSEPGIDGVILLRVDVQPHLLEELCRAYIYIYIYIDVCVCVRKWL